eukprot:scaffold109403_cov47-Attheya_sp.AAC.1
MEIYSIPPEECPDNPHAQYRCAQIATDADNCHSAMNHLFTEHTPALNTPENLHTVKLKFPPPLPSPPEINPHTCTRSSTVILSISYYQSFCMPPLLLPPNLTFIIPNTENPVALSQTSLIFSCSKPYSFKYHNI